MKRRLAATLGIAMVAFCAQAGSAFATQYFVDGSTGLDTNSCLQATDGADPLGPCLTIDHALDLAQANTGPDEVLVADDTYPETLVVGDGTVLRALDTTDPKPVIDGPSAVAEAVTIAGNGGSVDGFEIRSGFRSLFVVGAGSFTNNDFPTTAAPSTNQDVIVSSVTGSVLIAGNNFTDDGIGTQYAVFSIATSATNLTIQNNDFSGLNTAIWLQDGNSSPLIADNHFAGIHDSNGSGVLVYEGSPVIRNNTFDSPGAGFTAAVSLSDTNGATGAALSRNTITGLFNGVVAGETSLPVTLNSDLITGGNGVGLFSADTAAPGGGDVSATNATIYDNFTDVTLQDTALNLDSSIVGGAISINGTATCTISFSRGATLAGNASGCQTFQTTADPAFVGASNYHLQASSPMIDAGNTLAPAAGVFDIDGDLRALSAAPTCPGRRDIGADEFVPASPGPAVCPAEAVPPVPQPQPKKKCKKGRKLKKGKCVKKKRKKRKR